MIGLLTIVGRGFGELTEGIPSGSITLTSMQQDTLNFLNKWGEVLTVKRASPVYDSTGKATITWTTIGNITGDWQPLPGSAIVDEQGLEVKSSSQIIAAYDCNVLAGDRIYKAGGTYEVVNYVLKYEDHITIRMKKTE